MPGKLRSLTSSCIILNSGQKKEKSQKQYAKAVNLLITRPLSPLPVPLFPAHTQGGGSFTQGEGSFTQGLRSRYFFYYWLIRPSKANYLGYLQTQTEELLAHRFTVLQADPGITSSRYNSTF